MVQRIVASLACMLAVAAAQAQETPLMAAIFADHAVLQRDRPVDVFGRASAGEQVTVSLDAETRKTQADTSGNWSTTFSALRAGGPHTLSARTATRSQRVMDLLAGDVWLCSGQSNMEFAVRNALNAGWEVAHSANDRIRHVAIPRNPALAPAADFPWKLEWKAAGPTTTQDFSAVCYYMVRELQKNVDVPMGMIHSSWGGTRIETWLSVQALRQLGGNDAKLDLLGKFAADHAAGSVDWGRELQKWWTSQAATAGSQPWSVDKGTGKNTGAWQPAPAKLIPWEDWGVPALAEYDGVMWFRSSVKLSAAQAKQAAKVSLGVIDDVDEVWVNGQPIASGDG